MAINSLSASSHGLSGLVSGINSQDFVEKLLSGTQYKIDKTKQDKSRVEFKQDIYNDIIKKLKGLQDSFLSYASKTNLRNTTFYSKLLTNITPPSGYSAAFSVSAGSSAQIGTTTVDYIKSLATARRQKTTQDATGDVKGTLDRTSAQSLYNIYSGGRSEQKFTVGDDSITLGNLAQDLAGKSQAEVVDYLNGKFDAAGFGLEARLNGTSVEFLAKDSSKQVTIENTGAIGQNAFGGTKSGVGSVSTTIDTAEYMPGFDVTLDGKTQTVRLNLDLLREYANTGSNASADALAADIGKQLTRAFGSGVSVTNSSGQLEFTTGTISQKVTITGGKMVLDALGFESGISNKISTSGAIKDQNFAMNLEGSRHTFDINGVSFSFDSSASLSTIMNSINNSNAGVKVSYVEGEDRFVIENKVLGAGTADVEMSQSEGNLLTVLFGVEGGTSATGGAIQKDMVASSAFDTSELEKGGKVKLNINGTDVEFNIEWKEEVEDADGNMVPNTPLTAAQIIGSLNKSLEGYGRDASGVQNIELRQDASGALRVITNSDDFNVAITADDAKTASLGFAKGSTTLVHNASATLGEAGIDFGTGGNITLNIDGAGAPIVINTDAFSASSTLKDVEDAINNAITAQMGAGAPSVKFDERTARFKIDSDVKMDITVNGGSGAKDTDELLGAKSIQTGQGASAGVLGLEKAGTNAVLSINGVEQERATNDFTINGLTFSLNSTTYKDPNDVSLGFTAPTTIGVKKDTGVVMDALKSFVEQYNETVDFIYGLYREDATYKDYDPLTAEQKLEMTDNEIKLWEEKSKEGLLRGDQNLQRVLQNMRSVLYQKPEGSEYALYDIGITTTFSAGSGAYTGKLAIKDEEELLKLIESDPEALVKLFGGGNGIMDRLYNTIDAATKVSYGGGGYLVKMAGINKADTESTFFKQMKAMDDQLEKLERKYEQEYVRYWKQFNAMEQAIQKMNSQSGWLNSAM